MKNVLRSGSIFVRGIKMNKKQFETLLALESDQKFYLERIAVALEKLAKLIELG